MSSLSQALPLEYLPSSHSAFQEHAAHTARWPAVLSSKGSRGTCIPQGLLTFLHYAFTAHQDEVKDAVIAQFALWTPLGHGEVRQDKCGELGFGQFTGIGVVAGLSAVVLIMQ